MKRSFIIGLDIRTSVLRTSVLHGYMDKCIMKDIFGNPTSAAKDIQVMEEAHQRTSRRYK